jgi:hypothetical protein
MTPDRQDGDLVRSASYNACVWRGVWLAIGALLVLTACGGGRHTTPLEQGKVREIAVENRHVVGGELDVHVRRGDLLDLRVFVRGAGSPGGVVFMSGYGIAARVKRQPPASGFWARLRFRATRVGRFAVVMKRPHVRVGYVIVTPD